MGNINNDRAELERDFKKWHDKIELELEFKRWVERGVPPSEACPFLAERTPNA